MQTRFTCPDHEVAVAFELPTDAQVLAQLWSHAIRIDCPVCGGSHEMLYREAYVTGLMTQFRCIPADVQRARLH